MKVISIITFACFLVFPSISFAGLHPDEFPVVIVDNVDGTGHAEGSMSYARTADNEFEKIGCWVKANYDGVEVSSIGFCEAIDATNTRRVCVTHAPGLIGVLHGMGEFGKVEFKWDDGDVCTFIQYSKTSQWLPHFKVK